MMEDRNKIKVKMTMYIMKGNLNLLVSLRVKIMFSLVASLYIVFGELVFLLLVSSWSTISGFDSVSSVTISKDSDFIFFSNL